MLKSFSPGFLIVIYAQEKAQINVRLDIIGEEEYKTPYEEYFCLMKLNLKIIIPNSSDFLSLFI